MTSRGKHSSRDSGGFYKDLAMMIIGILLVGAAVFLLLFLLADGPSPTTTVQDATTTTTAETTTTQDQVTTTSSSTTSTSTTTTIPLRPPSDVRVIVLNSIGVTGAAGRLTDALGDAGYQTLEPDDYEPEQDQSRIWYRASFAPEAAELLALVPGAVIEVLPDSSLAPSADIIIIIGTGYEE